MIRLYDVGPSANCFEVRLALAQLGIEYERVPVDIFAGESQTDEYRAKNPAACFMNDLAAYPAHAGPGGRSAHG